MPLRGVSLAPLRSLLRPQPGLAAFAPPPPPAGALLADRQPSDPSNVRATLNCEQKGGCKHKLGLNTL